LRVKGQTEKNSWKIEYLQKFSKCNKNQKITKLPSKSAWSWERWKNALFIANNVILRFFFAQEQNFSKIHKTDKEIFLAKKSFLIILNDKPNSKLSRILMNPRTNFLNRLENDSNVKNLKTWSGHVSKSNKNVWLHLDWAEPQSFCHNYCFI
jgi:hypothetical protein